jgi:uncharacterized protein (DUF305 family)
MVVMRGRNVAYALLLVLAVAVAAAALFLWASSRPPGENSAEAGFARDMMVHHAQAVEMAEIVRDRTENPLIRSLATDIALTQQAQIGQMQGWLDVWGLSPTGTEKPMAWMGHPMDGPMPGMASREEIDRLGTLPPEKADELFLRLMIPHHEAAIPMARAIEERSDEPEVDLFAEKVMATQRAEVKNMQQMLKDMDAPPVEDEPSMDGMDMGGDHHGG